MSTPTRAEAMMTVVNAVCETCRNSLLANLTENAIKVAAMDALLLAGYTLMEGTSKTGHGRLIALTDGRLESSFVARPSKASVVDASKGSSPDIRIHLPVSLVLELQVRSAYGSQDAANTKAVYDDLLRVARRGADAFVLASDAPIYDSLRGERQGGRGRRLKYSFEEVLPPRAGMGSAFLLNEVEFDGTTLRVFSTKVNNSFGIDRIITGVMRREGPVRTV